MVLFYTIISYLYCVTLCGTCIKKTNHILLPLTRFCNYKCPCPQSCPQWSPHRQSSLWLCEVYSARLRVLVMSEVRVCSWISCWSIRCSIVALLSVILPVVSSLESVPCALKSTDSLTLLLLCGIYRTVTAAVVFIEQLL